MKNIHVLPTDKPSRLYYFTANKAGYYLYPNSELVIPRNPNCINQNIYITSDEEIKEGYYLDLTYNIVMQSVFYASSDKNCEKIILTTDPQLIQDGVQAIDDEFLERFVKNPSCEEVETIYSLFSPMGRQVDLMNLGQNHSQCVWKYKIIIPKEKRKIDTCYNFDKEIGCVQVDCRCEKEEPKQETLEEEKPYWCLIDKKADQNNSIDLNAYANGVEDGANWQKERSYSEEEVLNIVLKYELAKRNKGRYWSDREVEEWFEKIKKK